MTLAERLTREAFRACGHVCVARWLPGGADFEPGLCPACFARAIRAALREAVATLQAYAGEVEREYRYINPTGECRAAMLLRVAADKVQALADEARGR